jgi:hypothetical protein
MKFLGKSIRKFGRKRIMPTELTANFGIGFEHRVQTLFAVLLLTEGVWDAFPKYKISSLKFQIARDGYNLDDLLVEFINAESGNKLTLLGQIKSTISCSKDDTDFTDTIQAAWLDFVNTYNMEGMESRFALIAGPMNMKDTKILPWLLDKARSTGSHEEFLNYIEDPQTTSKEKHKVFALLQAAVGTANNDSFAESRLFWEFLRSFYIITPDLWYKGGITDSLCESLLISKGYKNAADTFRAIAQLVENHDDSGMVLTKELITEWLKQELVIVDSKLNYTNNEVVSKSSAEVNKPTVKLPNQNFKIGSIPQNRVALLALIGHWNENSTNDNDILQDLLQVDDRQLGDIKQELSSEGSAILTIKNGDAVVNNPKGVFDAFCGSLSENDVGRFKRCCTRILSEIDKRLDLPEDQRWYSGYEKSGLSCSIGLREGLSYGLALLGVGIGECSKLSVNTREYFVSTIVRKVLTCSSWKLWATLGDSLSLLAEADAGTFIKCVEALFKRRSTIIKNLFMEETSGIVGRSYMIGLVRALAIAAWQPDQFVGACRLLMELAKRDPGGRWNPRPQGALSLIFHPLAPHTLASVDKRIDVMKAFCHKYSDVGWTLLDSVLPAAHFSYMVGEQRPSVRCEGIPKDEELKGTDLEVSKQYEAYVELALNMASGNVERTKTLIRHSSQFIRKDCEQLFDRLERVPKKWGAQDRYEIMTTLLDVMRFGFGECPIEKKQESWAWQRLRELVEKYRPNDPVYSALPLFSWTTDQDEILGDRKDREQGKRDIAKERAAAVESVFKNQGMDGIYALAEHAERVDDIGAILGESADVNDYEVLPAGLQVERGGQRWLVQSFVRSRFLAKGWKWVASLGIESWTPDDKLNLMLMLPFRSDVWHRVKSILEDSENGYWERVYVVIADGEREWRYAIKRLLAAKRGYSVLSNVLRLKDIADEDKALVSFEILKRMAEEGCVEHADSLTSYHIQKAIKLIQDSEGLSLKQKVMIEWFYFGIFSFVGRGSLCPKSINVAIADDPKLFCELLCLAYLGKGDKKKARPKSDDHESQRVIMAWKTLHYWNGFPGHKGDGHVDAKKFSSWTKAVKAQARKDGRLKVALMVIGNAAAQLPRLQKGFWMDEAVARFLDAKVNDKALESFGAGLYNARGAHVLNAEKDKALAREYMKMADEADKKSYFNIGQTMRWLAAEVESTGKMFD